MRIIEGIFIGIAAIRSNKLRSLLTMLGIIIGIASVLAMIAIGDGAKEIVQQDVQKLGGANKLVMYRMGWKRVNNRWVRNRSNEYLKYGDVLAIEAECPSVKDVTSKIVNWSGGLIQASGGTETRAGWGGVDTAYDTAMDWDLKEGRFITDEDIENAAKICVLGDEVATDLFGDTSPLGQEIKIARRNNYSHGQWGRKKAERFTERFIVVGTLMPRGTSLRFGWGFDNIAFIPISTAQERFTGNDHIEYILIFANTVEDVPTAIEEVKTVVRKRHKNQDDFLGIFEMHAGMAQLEKISKVIKITLGSIAGFSLLVGGIGIMNMMLVAVTERTREIGLRKALGAKSFDILLQFLIEAIIMCGIGGAIGIGMGMLAGEGMAVLAVKIVKIVPEWPAVLSWQWVLISVSFSAIIGISFGLYPAIKASSKVYIILDPHYNRQIGYGFTVYPSGSVTDGVVRGSNNWWDNTWDGVWEVKTKIHDNGWAAEYKIPFYMFRFSPKEKYTWGLQVQREISRRKENDHWRLIRKGEPGWVSRFGDLTGIENIRPSRHLELIPYAMGRTTLNSETDLWGNLGGDVQYGITSGVTLNATVNPDFGQVEADPATLNLSAYEEFFEERRPFFVKGASNFNFGDWNTRFFYSRRIGRQPGHFEFPEGATELSRPEATTILGAAKIVGRTNSNTSFGIMEAVTAPAYAQIKEKGKHSDFLIEPLTNYYVGRVKQDILKGNSYIGLVTTAVNRQVSNAAYVGGLTGI